ncbi:unnamed protein product [Lactuca saligna]|uniref:Uncharacterized protein n=1 Tax=Lactuca saligna TaxID=75948 RepID=A0AA35VQZ5_LACSI|nr:unnamed protein product [Lactuca saligna]
MADSLLSSITTFHTTKIIVIDPSKYSFIGSIPIVVFACVSYASNVIQEYKKLPSSGPSELTPAMICSIEEANKPAKRGKKPKTQKEKKLKKLARRLILQSYSDSDSKYVPPGNKPTTPTESESKSSDEEASFRGDTPPRSPTLEVHVRSPVPSSPHVTIPISLPPTVKLSIQSLLGVAASNASRVTNSITKLEEAFAAKKQNFVHLRQYIQKDNVALLSSLNERLTKLQDDLTMENSLMD